LKNTPTQLRHISSKKSNKYHPLTNVPQPRNSSSFNRHLYMKKKKGVCEDCNKGCCVSAKKCRDCYLVWLSKNMNLVIPVKIGEEHASWKGGWRNFLTIAEAYFCSILWDINNGITLCNKCHKKIQKKESEYADYLTSLIKSNHEQKVNTKRRV